MGSTVIVASGATNKAQKFEDVTARTFGELKEVIGSLWNKDLDAVVKPGNVTLRDDDSILPTGNYNVYLVTKKNEAGAAVLDANTIAEEIYQAILKAQQIVSTSDMTELKDSLIEAIEDHYSVDLRAPEAAEAEVEEPEEEEDDTCTSPECLAAIEEARQMNNH